MLKTAISLPYPEFEFNKFEQVSQIRRLFNSPGGNLPVLQFTRSPGGNLPVLQFTRSQGGNLPVLQFTRSPGGHLPVIQFTRSPGGNLPVNALSDGTFFPLRKQKHFKWFLI